MTGSEGDFDGGEGSQASRDEAPSNEQLLRALADRDRQLRDLTEQALGFLEELADTRRRSRDGQRLSERVGELERLLTDARRRLRKAGGFAPRESDGHSAARPTSAGLEVVFWGAGATADARACATKHSDLPVSWVGVPGEVPPDANTAERVRWINSGEARTPAQCWNLAMSATDAEVVLFLAAGVRTDAAPRLAESAADPTVALLCPRLSRGDENFMGCDEFDEYLRLAPRLATLDELPAVLSFPNPEAFVLRRAAFEKAGFFDEALLGSTALAEYALRVRERAFQVLGEPGILVADDSPGRPDPHDDADRMLLLATHRPAVLGRALADAPVLWAMDPNQIPSYLVGLFARLRQHDDAPVPQDLVSTIAVDMVEHAAPGTTMAAMVQDLRVQLIRSLLRQDLPTGREELQAALDRAERQRPRSLAAAFAELSETIALDQRIRQVMLQVQERTRAEMGRVQTERNAQETRAQAAEIGQRDAQRQLNELHARAESAEAARDAAQEQLEHAQQQNHAAQEQLEHAQQQNHAAQEQLEYSQQQAHAAQKQIAELEEQFAATARAIELEGKPESGRVRERLLALRERAQQLEQTLEATGVNDAVELIRVLSETRNRLSTTTQTLAERDRWIGALLQEVVRRRLFPRKLLDHERAFLQEGGGGQ